MATLTCCGSAGGTVVSMYRLLRKMYTTSVMHILLCMYNVHIHTVCDAYCSFSCS